MVAYPSVRVTTPKSDAFVRHTYDTRAWKEILSMLSQDLLNNTWEGRVLNWDKFGDLIVAGIKDSRYSKNLLMCLPHIKANSKCHTPESKADNVIAKWVCSLLFGTKDDKKDSEKYEKYRKLKSKAISKDT